MIITSGKRKRSIVTIILNEGTGKITVNNRDYKEYFSTYSNIYKILQPFKCTSTLNKYDVKAKAFGGGFTGQCDALQLAIAKGLLETNIEHRKILKEEGLLTRNSKIKERKKYGLKKARRAPQFSKR